MEKEQEQNQKNKEDQKSEELKDSNQEAHKTADKETQEKEQKELTPEEKIIELEDKLVRAFAEMENQRRRFEKEKEEALYY